MDFDSFKSQVKKLSDLIRVDSFQPDIVVAVARGGWIPSVLLSRAFSIKKLYSFGLNYTDTSRTAIDTYQMAILPADAHKILVVEDFIESGKCIKHAVQSLSVKSLDVRSAALGYLEKTIHTPNYSLGCVAEIPKLPWD